MEGYLDDSPSQGKYQYLKDILIREYELSKIVRDDNILDLTAVADKRPSELMGMIMRLHGLVFNQMCFLESSTSWCKKCRFNSSK